MDAEQNLTHAWQRLKALYPCDEWFSGVHLEENKPRLLRMMGDLMQRLPPGPDTKVVDVGCYNGFLCYLTHQLGYQSAGVDAIDLAKVPERARIMTEIGAPYYLANFNHLDPFPGLSPGQFDAAILGEVIEHIFNHPVGLLSAIGRLLKPGGYLMLTTPNPRTLLNAVRLVTGGNFMWGETEFATIPKVDAAGVFTACETIHYREYSQPVLLDMLRRAGFEIEIATFMGIGAAPGQSAVKQFLKALPACRWLQSHQIFGMSHYIVARQPA
jgi:2-polyprenyl-3-methyl-5-hydroxy-6-metoxy-1,4-benzoquinol methylase